MESKIVFVTGAIAGFGAAIARRFVAEGGSVVAGDIAEAGLKDLAAELGNRCAPLTGDVTREGDVEHMVATAVERFGGEAKADAKRTGKTVRVDATVKANALKHILGQMTAAGK